MAAEVDAWLVEIDSDFSMAFGVHEVIDICEPQNAHRLPIGRPGYDEILLWQGQVIPLIYLGDISQHPGDVIVVVACQPDIDEPVRYLAFRSRTEPLRIIVNDEMSASLPEHLGKFEPQLLSCFKYDEKSVLVADCRLLLAVPDEHELMNLQ